MNEADRPLQDIRSTGKEAERWERWLEDLESGQAATPTDKEAAEPASNPYTRSITDSAKDQAHPALVLLIISIIASPLILLGIYQNGGERSSTSAPAASLGYSASCGSTGSTSGRWWPVLGTGDQSLLITIRSRYCGDAFINGYGALQVGSFGSWEEADRFKASIEQATGQSFRVGLGSVPGG